MFVYVCEWADHGLASHSVCTACFISCGTKMPPSLHLSPHHPIRLLSPQNQIHNDISFRQHTSSCHGSAQRHFWEGGCCLADTLSSGWPIPSPSAQKTFALPDALFVKPLADCMFGLSLGLAFSLLYIIDYRTSAIPLCSVPFYWFSDCGFQAVVVCVPRRCITLTITAVHACSPQQRLHTVVPNVSMYLLYFKHNIL